MNNFDYKNMTPFKWFVLENFPFVENDFDAINNYHLFSKFVVYLNKTIDNMNLTGEQMKNVTNAMTELQNYVNNYFNNLDVQEEINNKLDEMVESGYFTNLMTTYLNISHVYNTINNLIEDNNIVKGQTIKTLGYNNIFDNGGAFYLITDVENTDKYQVNLNNGLFAELIFKDIVSIKQLGAISNENFDCKNIIDTAIKYFDNIFIPSEEFYTSNININKTVKIDGVISKSILKPFNNQSGNLIEVTANYTQIKNISLIGDKNKYSNILNGINLNPLNDGHILIENVNISQFTGTGLINRQAENRIFNLYTFRNNGNGLLSLGSDSIFENITSAFNYETGIREGGSSNRWITCKAFGNGESYNVNISHNQHAYGFRISDSYGSQFIQCDAQENYSHGFYVSSYKNLSMISCNSDCNGMINKNTQNESDFIKIFGFIFTSVENVKLIGFTNNFRYQSSQSWNDVRWQYASISCNNNVTNSYFDITSLKQIKELYIENYTIKNNTLYNNNNIFILNGKMCSISIDKMKIRNNLNNSSILDFEEKDSTDYYRIVRSTDNSLRIMHYSANGLLENGNILQINSNNGMVVGSNMLGFFGKIPVTKSASKENATDLSSAIALVNDLKYHLTRLGLIN